MLCLLSCGRVSAGIRVQDDNGQPVVLEHPAARIVSLSPHITELLFAVGAGEVAGTVRRTTGSSVQQVSFSIGNADQ